jgi:hypothetical protein
MSTHNLGFDIHAFGNLLDSIVALCPTASDHQELPAPLHLRTVNILPGRMATWRPFESTGEHIHQASNMADRVGLLLLFCGLRARGAVDVVRTFAAWPYCQKSKMVEKRQGER